MVTQTAARHLPYLSRATPEHADAGGVGLAHGQPRLPKRRLPITWATTCAHRAAEIAPQAE